MRNFIIALWIASTGGVLCPAAFSETTNFPITFYFVHEKKIDGGVLFDALCFPRLGYIGSEPDLTITNLESVTFEQKPDHKGQISDEAKGSSRPVTIHPAPTLSFTLLREDEARLKTLAEKAAAKGLLVLFKEKPFALVSVDYLVQHNDIDFGILQNYSEFRNKDVLMGIAEDLKKLLHKTVP